MIVFTKTKAQLCMTHMQVEVMLKRQYIHKGLVMNSF